MVLRSGTGRWQDWANLVLGIWLFISPWVLAFVVTGGQPWSAWISGVIVFFVALWALAQPSAAWTEWINGIVGIWLFISPWVLHFEDRSRDAWNAWIVGAAIFILAVWALAQIRRRPPVGNVGPYGPTVEPGGPYGNTGPLGTWAGPRSVVPPTEPPLGNPPREPINP